MVYKGCILKEEENYIIVLTNNSKYIKLKKKGPVNIGKEIMFLEEDILKTSSVHSTVLTTVAAAIIFLFITTAVLKGFGFQLFGNASVYAMVSLDINPSIHFQVDEDKKVQKNIPLNEEANNLLTPAMVGMSIEDALHLAIKNAIDQHYLNKESDVVLISKVNLQGHLDQLSDIKQTIIKEIEEDEEIEDIEILYVDSSKEDFENSQKENISIGKYELYQQIQSGNSDESLEEIKAMKITEIVNKNKAFIKVKPFVKHTDDKIEDSLETEAPIEKEENSAVTVPEKTPKETHNNKEKDVFNPIQNGQAQKPPKTSNSSKESTSKDVKNPIKKAPQDNKTLDEIKNREHSDNNQDKHMPPKEENKENKNKPPNPGTSKPDKEVKEKVEKQVGSQDDSNGKESNPEKNNKKSTKNSNPTKEKKGTKAKQTTPKGNSKK